MNTDGESFITIPPFEMHSRHPEFVEAIQDILASNPAGKSEHALIRELQNAGHFDGWISEESSLALFHKHFAVMHCLYHLQPHYVSCGQQLAISPLRIQLLSASSVTDSKQVTTAVGIQAYYLDWSNFSEASVESVAELLSDFWKRFSGADKTSAALEVLGLDAKAQWPQVQAQYRRLAAEHHPDKGGDRITFAEVRDAYEILKARFKP